MVKDDFLNDIPDQYDPLLPDEEPSDLDAFLASLDLESDLPADPEAPTFPIQESEDWEQEEKPAWEKPAREKPVREKPARPKPAQKEPEDSSESSDGFIRRHLGVVNLLLVLVCLGLVAGIAAVILLQQNADPLGGRVMENVYVAGINIGGMTKDQALAAVNAASDALAENDMVVELGSGQLLLSSAQANPVLDVRAAVEAAYSLGRTGSASQRQQDYQKARKSPVEISGYLSVNTDHIRSVVSDFIGSVSGEYSPSSYYLEGERPALDADNFDPDAPCQTLVLEIGSPGSQFDLDGICSAICQGYSQNNFRPAIPQEYLPQLPEKLDIDAIYHELHVDAVEAAEENGAFVPGSCGYTFDLETARAQLSAATFGQVISVPMAYIVPDKLDNNGTFTETLSSFSTPLSSNEAYNQNMTLLCQKLDGLVLEPGEIFSFNTFFKARSEQDGYQKAPRHGECCMEEVVCGGIDQLASTLYVAAKTADVTVSEKHQGDHLCTYTPKGTELTVGSSWQDLKLSNSLKFPVKIRAHVANQQVVIRFLSEQPVDYYIRLESQEGYTLAHGTSFAFKKADEGFTKGETLIEGVDGGQVTLNWVKYDKATDTELSRTSEFLESRPMSTVLVSISG